MTHTLRPNLPPLPARIARLPIDERGYPVPWFVAWIDGKPEFRTMDARKLQTAIEQERCWICGEILGAHMAFVIGPMCIINRISAEPPSHRDCALFAVQACPFMVMPKMKRREGDLPDDVFRDEAHLDRNPGVMVIWITRTYEWFERPKRGVLFAMGDPEELHWYCEGRAAARTEVLNSFHGGMPALEAIAREEGPDAVQRISKRYAEAMRLVDETVPEEAQL